MTPRIFVWWSVAALVVVLAAAGPAGAGLIPVHTEAELAPALAAAVAGDTVLVDCGTYRAQGLVLNDGVTLRSVDGAPDCVVIMSDGSAPILTCAATVSVTRIEGVTFTLAAGVLAPTVARGGGLKLADASPAVTACVFRGLGANYGGAVHCSGTAEPLFQSCEFTGNTARAVGGAINAVAGAAPRLAACVLADNSAGGTGAAINVATGARPVLVACTIVQGDVWAWDDGVSELSHTILTGGLVAGDPSSVPLATCTNVYLGGADPWVGFLEPLGLTGDNFSADPLFCGTAATGSPYQIAAESPCAVGSTAGCGQVGALGVGCSVSAVPDDTPAIGLPAVTAILGNHPNPFNPGTMIRYRVGRAGPVRLAVYDVAGRLMRELASGERTVGTKEVHWDGRSGDGRPCAAGVYFVHLKAADTTTTHRISLIK